MKFTTLTLASLLVVVPLHAFGSSVNGIVINDDDGISQSKALGAPFESVVRVIATGSLCSGALISSTAVLTAKHCISSTSPVGVQVQFTDGEGVTQDARAASSVSAMGTLGSPLLDGTDLAVISFSSPIVGYTPFRLATDLAVRDTIRSVGYGLNGVGSLGHEFSRDGGRWAVDNIVDAIGQAATVGGPAQGTANIVSTDFDDGTVTANTLAFFGSSASPIANEGTTAPGDSGGPLLVQRGGEWLIGGILSGGTSQTSVFGDVSWWTGVADSAPRAFVEAAGGQYGLPSIPLPATAWMLLAGVLCLRTLRRRAKPEI